MIKDKSGISLILVMITIAVFALILRLAIEQIVKLNIQQNETNAFATLKLISVAIENYAKDHQGTYPLHLSSLLQSKPAYLDRDYAVNSLVKGYSYTCSRLEAASYSCSAAPVKCKLSGKKIFTISTGGILASEECGKKE